MIKTTSLSFETRKPSIKPQKKTVFLKEEISDFLKNLGQKRLDLKIELSSVVDKLKYGTRTIHGLEKGDVHFVQYPFNYFFSKKYAHYLGIDFPIHFNMQSFKRRE